MLLLECIRLYIETNNNDFFPEKTRNKFIAYVASQSFKTPVQDFNTLREYFNKMENKNQSRVIFIFNHILE